MPSRLTDLLPQIQLDRAAAPLSEAWTLPPAAYTQPSVFHLEIQTLFHGGWVCVAREEQVRAPGDYLCADVVGQPVMIVRDMAGELRAMSSVCLHRAMPVAAGAGNTTRFVCPYHRWTYGLDGSLRSAPMMQGVEGFEAERWRLPQLALEVWEGFVFVNGDGGAEPLAPQLSGLHRLVRGYGFGDLVISGTAAFDSPWNWKVLVENFMEAYHHIGTHQNSLQPLYPAKHSSVPDNDDQPWAFLRMPGIAEPEGPLLPGLGEAQRRDLFAAAVFPTFLFAGTASSGVWYQLEPRAHDAMHLRVHLLLPEAVRDAMGLAERDAALELVRVVHMEDIGANDGVWRGLRAPLAAQGRLGPLEKAIWQLNRYWLRKLA